MITRRFTPEEYEKINTDEAGDLIYYLRLVRSVMRLPEGERHTPLNNLRKKVEYEQRDWLDYEDGDAFSCRWWFYINGVPTDFDMKYFVHYMMSEDSLIPDLYKDMIKAIKDVDKEELITRSEWVLLLFYGALRTELRREEDWLYLHGKRSHPPKEPKLLSAEEAKKIGGTERGGRVLYPGHDIRLKRIGVSHPASSPGEDISIDIDAVKNCKLREYEKLAENILNYSDLQRRMDTLDGLMEKIRDESNGLIVEESSLRAKYYIREDDSTNEEEFDGPFDYEVHKAIFKSDENRHNIQRKLNKLNAENESLNASFTDYQIYSLYCALKIERDNTEQELICQNRKKRRTKNVPNHFDLQNTTECRNRLLKVLKRLKDEGYLFENILENDWVYYCTGKGNTPTEKLRWLKDDDELGYFIKEFFSSTKNKYDRAALCFLLRNGNAPNSTLLRTNATQKQEKTEPLYNIIHLK